ncbi:MAG: CBS domain-containing protein [Alphaproteobacteria bacterium GM7ARS4]|nr:CBS domain-containing protein [Alphaproteobacteria bacterium GM7ARS4]
MQRKIIPDVINQPVIHSVPSDSSEEHNVGALIVFDGQKNLTGIISERDILHKIVAAGKDAKKILVREVMTPNPHVINKDDTAIHALKIFSEQSYRHLPVTENGVVLGLVSIRDIFKVCLEQFEEDLEQRDQFIRGENYGGA